MPKATTITKKIIIDSAFEIVRKDGFTFLSARNIAKNIGCSTQPIYWAYKNMEDLKQEVIAKMISYLSQIISSYKKTGKPFLDYGLGYIHVAYTDPMLFKAIYVDNILSLKMTDIVPEKQMLELMKQEKFTFNLSEELLLQLAVKTWIFTHGLASLIASGMLIYEEQKVGQMLVSFVETLS